MFTKGRESLLEEIPGEPLGLDGLQPVAVRTVDQCRTGQSGGEYPDGVDDRRERPAGRRPEPDGSRSVEYQRCKGGAAGRHGDQPCGGWWLGSMQ